MKAVIKSRSPSWGDMQALLDALFTAEEKQMVFDGARKDKESCIPGNENLVYLPIRTWTGTQIQQQV